MKIPHDELKQIIAKNLNIPIENILDIKCENANIYVKVADSLQSINIEFEVNK